MPNILTTDDLILQARDLAGVPNTEVPGTDDPAVLRFLNEVFLSKIVPRLMRVKQSYFGRNAIIPMVATQSKYRMPARAIGLKLDNIIHRANFGASPSFNTMTKIAHEDRYRVTSHDTIPRYFYIEGNYIVIVPEQDSKFTGFLEVPYFLRPGRLVPADQCRKITAVNLVTRTVTLADLPAIFTNGETYDVHSGVSGAEQLCMDLTVASSTVTTVTFNEEIDGSVFGSHPVSVGDYLCLADTACVPALPRDFDDCLIQAGVVKLVQCQGDQPSVVMEAKLLEDKIRDAISTAADRIESKPDRIRFPSVVRQWR